MTRSVVPDVCPERLKRGPFRRAWWKGFAARLAGLSQAANPYPDHRTFHGSVTFSRGFWRAWNRGWEAADEEVKWGSFAGDSRFLLVNGILFRLRPVSPDDGEFLLTLIKTRYYLDSQVNHVPFLMEYFCQKDRESWLAEEPGGSSVALMVTTEKTPHLYVSLLLVCPRWRRVGIGRALLGFDEGVAVEKGRKVRLFSSKDGPVGFYRRAGYEVIEQQNGWVMIEKG